MWDIDDIFFTWRGGLVLWLIVLVLLGVIAYAAISAFGPATSPCPASYQSAGWC